MVDLGLKHVGFTGTQEGMIETQIFRLTHLLNWLYTEKGFRVLHHGDCQGADAQAHYLWHGLGGNVRIHPPVIAAKRAFCEVTRGDSIAGALDYISRNHAIVDESFRLIVAPLQMEEVRRSGTWATFRYAKRLKRPIHVVFPNGEVLNYNV